MSNATAIASGKRASPRRALVSLVRKPGVGGPPGAATMAWPRLGMPIRSAKLRRTTLAAAPLSKIAVTGGLSPIVSWALGRGPVRSSGMTASVFASTAATSEDDANSAPMAAGERKGERMGSGLRFGNEEVRGDEDEPHAMRQRDNERTVTCFEIDRAG